LKSKSVLGIVLIVLLGSLFFSSIFVKSETEEHDLVASWETPIIDDKNHIRNGTSTVLNATVLNSGSSVEDVTLQILINGSIVLNSLRDDLAPGHIFWSAYYWTPEEGDYYVTAYTSPVENETLIENNNDTKRVRVSPDHPPIANFTFEPTIQPNIVLVDENVTFNASASHDDSDWGEIESYYWNWNNGSSDNTTITPIINHTFQDWGTYNVTLTVIDNKGLNESAYQVVYVEKKPLARFDVSEGHIYREPLPENSFYVNDTLIFDASISRPDGGEIIWYHWDFGDGTTMINITSTFTMHNYTSTGIYNVTLTIGDNNTLTDQELKTLNITTGFPIAGFTILNSPPYYVNDTLTFTASASHDSDWGDIISYNWDFGDGTLRNETNPETTHNYTTKGDYTVVLTVADNTNLISNPVNTTLSLSLRVYLRIEPSIVTVNPGEYVDINITIENVEDLKTFVFKMVWPPDWLSPSWPILFEEPVGTLGDFLGEEFNDFGQRRWNKVGPYADACEGYLFFNCTFFTTVVPVENRSGSGTIINIQALTKSSGNTSLHLIDTLFLDSDGDTILHEIEDSYLYTTRPVANFIYSPRPTLPNQTVTFNASLSYDPDNPYDSTPGPITDYHWDFSDGFNDTGMIVTHAFASGVFPVNLTVTDDDGETWWIVYYVTTANVTLNIKPCVLAFNETLGQYETAGILPINVNVTNNGIFTETFNVTIYANDTAVETQNVTVLATVSESLDFYLAASSLTRGDYNLSVHVVGSIEYCDRFVRVYCTGDVDRDNDVDLFDVITMSNVYGMIISDDGSICDLDCDGDVDIFDITLMCMYYGVCAS